MAGRPLNPNSLPDIMFGSSDPAESRAIGRLVRAGRLRKLAPRLYTSDLTGAPEAIVRRNWISIVAHFFPGSVVSHRTAFRGGSPEDGIVFVTGNKEANIKFPGLWIRAVEGPGPLDGDLRFPSGLYLASEPRMLLENLQPSRSRKSLARTVGPSEVEARLERICQIQGDKALNEVREKARARAPQLGATAVARELPKLDQLIGAILGTQPAAVLRTPVARARAAGQPYDRTRIQRFEQLAAALNRSVFPMHSFQHRRDAWINAAFFDAYFSNYIDGTEFEPEEAANIVFHGKLIETRPEDSHDILGTYRVVSDRQRFPQEFMEFETLLRQRHATILQGRPRMGPGSYKDRANRAGGTELVTPELVRGTLSQGFALYPSLGHPFARAVYVMFLVTEVHPFTDGNGRVARAMMNAELAAENQSRILIPTVYREDYLMGLRNMTRNEEPEPLIRMLERAWKFTAQLPFEIFDTALATLRACNAFEQPSEAKLILPNDLTDYRPDEPTLPTL